MLTTGGRGTTRRYRGGRSRETQDPEYNREFEADNALVSGAMSANTKDEIYQSVRVPLLGCSGNFQWYQDEEEESCARAVAAESVREGWPGVAPARSSLLLFATRRSIVPVGLCKRPQAGVCDQLAPLLFNPLNSSQYVSLFHTMSPYNDHHHHAAIKSESPPLPISSIGQPYSQYSDSTSLFRFGTKEQQTAPLPPFSFISRPRSPHSAMSHLNAYSPAVSVSQSHFAVPPADELTPTDEYDDGDEGGDFPSASGSSSKDKSVRRRSSKGSVTTLCLRPF
jgi:hypothetical protein